MGTWQIYQNSSHIDTGNDLASSMVVCVQCDQNKAKQQWDLDKPRIQAARQMKNIHDFPDEAGEFDAVCSERQKEDGDSSGASNAMRFTSTHPDRQGTGAEGCRVKRRRRGP